MKKITALFMSLAMMTLCATAFAEVFLSQPPEGWTKDVLRITALPVGEGDALLIECGGEAMMIDGGPNPFRDSLMAALDERGIRHMRYMVNTHYHDDHINGLYHLMKNGYTADSYLHPYSDYYVRKDKLQSRTVEMAKRRGMAVGRLYDGDERMLGSAHIRFYRYTEIMNANAKSLVTRITYGNSSALLCADIIGKTQEYFTANLPPEELKADVMKIPHHGITPRQQRIPRRGRS